MQRLFFSIALSWIWSSSAGDLQITVMGNSGSQGVENCTKVREENKVFSLKAGCSVNLKTMKVSTEEMKLLC